VAPEPGEPLLLYIAATTELVSLVLVIEWLEPQQPQVPKGAPTIGSGSQDPDPVGEPGDKEAVEPQLPDPAPSLESHGTFGSQLWEAMSGPEDPHVTGS
jgi:hypothetical protein